MQKFIHVRNYQRRQSGLWITAGGKPGPSTPLAARARARKRTTEKRPSGCRTTAALGFFLSAFLR